MNRSLDPDIERCLGAQDTRGPGNTTRRLMFGWITGGVSAAVNSKTVPYWQSAHSLMRTVTVRGGSIVQLPAAGTYEPLRAAKSMVAGPVSVQGGNASVPPTPLPAVHGARQTQPSVAKCLIPELSCC